MKKTFFLCVVSMLLSIAVHATITLGTPFTDGMVLQRESKVAIWGKAEPNANILIKGSWDYKDIMGKVDAEGNWRILLPTPKGSFSSYAVTITVGDEVCVIRDVLIGEVWLASGQSNMQMPMQGWKDCPVAEGPANIQAAANYSGKLHFMNVPNVVSREPLNHFDANWQDCNPETVKNFSAVAFFFATQLIAKLQCPVGILNCNRGGSSVEAWLPTDILQTYPNVDLSDKVYENMKEQTPAVLYNAKLYPLIGYTLKGFIWYQGEANVGKYREEYANRFLTMIQRWRKDWKMPKLPFYFVEIAPYNYKDANATRAAFLREQQSIAFHKGKFVGMVGGNDLAAAKEGEQIHPANKKIVGIRLANWALAEAYKQIGIAYKHPEYKSMKKKKNRIYLTLTNVPNGFNRIEGITGFELCGSDSIFHAAKATVKEGKVILSSTEVSSPIAVRYCFKNFQLGNLANKEGLSVIPFRTDKFPYKQ